MTRSLFTSLLLTFALSGCLDQVVHDLDEPRANAILVALSSQGIDATKTREPEGWTIEVPRGERSRAMALIESERLSPTTDGRPTPSRGFLSTREERSYVLKRQIAADLERSLRQIPGVRDARVHVSAPSHDDGKSHQELTQTAGALLVHDPLRTIDVALVQSVIGSAIGVDHSKVSVSLIADDRPASAPATRRVERVRDVAASARRGTQELRWGTAAVCGALLVWCLHRATKAPRRGRRAGGASSSGDRGAARRVESEHRVGSRSEPVHGH
ncbi:MAG: hypothetical protein IT290_07200 [Deltaproteobacteria bacterium]|nr:hypothetical protein [Deltaproteobacteria bacterium]